jgi:hypothetical protein
MRTERDLDEAIDRAVREIMSSEPRAGLRGRVLERLERAGSNWITVPRLAAAAALVTIVLAGLLLSRPRPADVEPPTLAKSQPQPHAPDITPQVTPRPVPVPAETKQPAQARAARPTFPPRGRVSAANVAATTTFVDETREVPRLMVVDGLPPPTTIFDNMTIQRITIPPIIVAPKRPPQ